MPAEHQEEDDSDEDEDREEVMVPMADALNAGWGKNNVSIALFQLSSRRESSSFLSGTIVPRR